LTESGLNNNTQIHANISNFTSWFSFLYIKYTVCCRWNFRWNHYLKLWGFSCFLEFYKLFYNIFHKKLCYINTNIGIFISSIYWIKIDNRINHFEWHRDLEKSQRASTSIRTNKKRVRRWYSSSVLDWTSSWRHGNFLQTENKILAINQWFQRVVRSSNIRIQIPKISMLVSSQMKFPLICPFFQFSD